MKKILTFSIFFFLLAGLSGCKKEDNVTTIINEFIENHYDYYFNEFGEVDYYFLSGLKAIDYELEEFDSAKTKSYYDSLDYSIQSNAFKATVVCSKTNVNYDSAKTALRNYTSSGKYELAYTSIALSISKENDSLNNTILNSLNVIDPLDYRDADYASIALIASSKSDIDKTSLYSLINESLSKDGVVTWGSANCCSTANVILALIANGIDPDSSEYETEGVSLIDQLLSYEYDNAFKSYKNDEEKDLSFSSTQAFAALCAYQKYKNTNNSYNIFLD